MPYKTLAALTFVPALLAAAPARQDDPLTRPIEPVAAARWLGPQPPMRVHGKTYLVGFSGLNVALIKTSAGLILIDGAVPQGVAAIEANIRRLGFNLKDVKLILSTEPHADHAGGLAALARDTGATVVASPQSARWLRSGRIDPEDPQFADLSRFPTVRRLRVVRDGEVLRLGDTAVTAQATPGHTAGSMSWTWRSCEATDCANIVFASSINPGAASGYRFSDPRHRGVVAYFRATFAKVRALPCDILLSAHADASGGDARAAAALAGTKPNPFVDRSACNAYADNYEAVFDAKLKREAGQG